MNTFLLQLPLTIGFAAAACPSYLESGVKDSEPSLGSMDTCEYHSPNENPFFSREDLVEDMANPTITYRYCYYPCLDEIVRSKWSSDWTYQSEKVCGKYFEKRIKDGENTRVFEDTMYDADPNIIGNDREPHAAIAYSDEGTVCFNHLYRDESISCTNCCKVTCFGLSNPNETHELYYRNVEGNRWFMEMKFSSASSGGSGGGGGGGGGDVDMSGFSSSGSSLSCTHFGGILLLPALLFSM